MSSSLCRRVRRIAMLACVLLLTAAYTAGAAKEAKRRPPIDLMPFAVNASAWQVAPSALIQRSNGELKQGLCKSELMYANRGQDAFTFLGSKVEECVVRLEGQKSKNLYILLRYAKDEEQPDQIKTAFSQAQELLNQQCRKTGKRLTFAFANGREVSIRQWETPAARIYLYCNETAPAAYLSALVERADLPERDMKQRLSVSRSSLPAQDGGNGQILAVPMRHQLRGLGGGCTYATLARQLAYLGSESEPQMIWQMIGDEEEKQLELMGKELGFYVKTYSLFTAAAARRNAADLLTKYNALAGARGAAIIKCQETATAIIHGDHFAEMNVALLKEIPPSDEAKYSQFRKIVVAAIDHGIPISWTVVGSSPKSGSKGTGKHRRLIIGYDTSQDLVYFSDSWGFNADCRPMPFRGAFAMTVWMQAVCPSSLPASKLP